MSVSLLVAAAIIIACVLFNKLTDKLGIPALLAFILLGMLFGSDGLVKIHFNNYEFAEQICSVALIFIMFYGGAGTNLKAAKETASKAIILSSLGTILTALFVGLFCRFVLKFELYESFLIGAVICSTDAASVFSILRSKKLNLKYGTASLLEVESGSNDPFSYMLTVIVLSLMNGSITGGKIAVMLLSQISLGLLSGVLIAFIAVLFLKRFNASSEGFDAVFVIGIAILAYAVPSVIGGNGYLSVYVAGIILGNTEINNKRSLVHFFDGVTGFMQMLLFFLLGLLSFPSRLHSIAVPALLTAFFLTFIARPAAVFILLTPFKCSLRQQALISWAGLRGAASIVFAIMTVVNPASYDSDIFHIVFFIVLFSILIQGSLLPLVTKILDMYDDSEDVMKTFSDYTYELPVSFIKINISGGHHWNGKKIKDIDLPQNLIIMLVIRGEKNIIPNGHTELCADDTVILCGKSSEKIDGVHLYEREISADDSMCGKKLKDVSGKDEIIVMVKRGEKLIIPHGNTHIKEKDIVVVNKNS